MIYYQRNRDVILNRIKKKKKKEYGKNRYNMSEEIKQRQKEYQKNYRQAKKS